MGGHLLEHHNAVADALADEAASDTSQTVLAELDQQAGEALANAICLHALGYIEVVQSNVVHDVDGCTTYSGDGSNLPSCRNRDVCTTIQIVRLSAQKA